MDANVRAFCDILTENNSNLVNLLSNTLGSVLDKLLEIHLIPEDFYEKGIQEQANTKQISRRLLVIVREKFKSSNEVTMCEEFLQVLIDISYLEDLGGKISSAWQQRSEEMDKYRSVQPRATGARSLQYTESLGAAVPPSYSSSQQGYSQRYLSQQIDVSHIRTYNNEHSSGYSFNIRQCSEESTISSNTQIHVGVEPSSVFPKHHTTPSSIEDVSATPVLRDPVDELIEAMVVTRRKLSKWQHKLMQCEIILQSSRQNYVSTLYYLSEFLDSLEYEIKSLKSKLRPGP